MNANWKTSLWGTLTAVSTGIVGLCVAISQAATTTGPNDVDPLLNLILYSIPARWRAYAVLASAVVAVISGQRFAHHAKSKDVTGGTTQQTTSGAVAKIGSQSLVDQTVLATIESGEKVTPEQAKAVESKTKNSQTK